MHRPAGGHQGGLALEDMKFIGLPYAYPHGTGDAIFIVLVQ
jgi:hypothetical protein